MLEIRCRGRFTGGSWDPTTSIWEAIQTQITQPGIAFASSVIQMCAERTTATPARCGRRYLTLESHWLIAPGNQMQRFTILNYVENDSVFGASMTTC